MRHITSFVSTVSKGIVFCTSAAILALGASGPAAGYQGGWKFGLVGVVFNASQAVRINVANWDPNFYDPDGDGCVANVQFFDGTTGTRFKQVELRVPSGQTQSADLGVTELILQKGKVPIYASVAFNGVQRPASVAFNGVCNPIPYRTVLEVFDKITGRTAVAVDPGPDPVLAFPPTSQKFGTPGLTSIPSDISFPALTVAPGQAMRLNVVNFEPPIVLPPTGAPGPCTVQLRIFAADGTQVAEQRVTLAPGVGDFLDVAWDPNNFPAPYRATGSPIAGQCSNLVFSVEVYDTATGIDTGLYFFETDGGF